MADLAQAYVQVVPSAQGISGKIAEVLDPESKSAGVKAGNNIATELGSKLKGVLIGLGIGKMIGDAITSGMEFEGSMTKASTLFTGTAEELQGLQTEIMGISNATGVSAAKLAEAAYSAESASVPMENLGGMIEASSKLATAGFTDIDTALSATAKTMNTYGMVTEDAAETQANMEKVQKILIQTQNKGITTVGELGASLSQVTPTAAAFGVSFEQVGASLAGMTAQGTSTAQATTQLNSLIAELGKDGTQAVNNLKEAAKGTEYAGMSFTQMMESGATLDDVLGMLDEHATKNKKSMVDMFSSIEAGKAALSINNSDFSGNLQAMATDADVVGDAYAKMADTAGFKLNKLKNSLKNTGINAFAAIADPLSGVVDGIAATFDRLAPSANALGGAFMNLMGSVGQYIGDLLGLQEGFTGVDLAVAVIQPAIDGLSGALNFLAQNMDIVMPIVTGAVAAFASFQIGTKLAGITAAVTTACEAAGGLGPLIAGLVSPFGIAVVAIGALVAAGVALYQNWDTVKAKAQEIAGQVSEKWTAIKASVGETIEGIKTTASEKFESVKSTATEKFESIKSKIEEKIQGAKDTVRDAIEKIKGFFDFDWKLPDIKLPHFSVDGEFSLNPPSIPHFSVDWYAKGGIVDGASIVGVGEAGPEAIIPLSGNSMLPFANAIADRISGRGGEPRTYEFIIPVVLNGREIARASAAYTQEELDRLNRNDNRKAGLAW